MLKFIRNIINKKRERKNRIINEIYSVVRLLDKNIELLELKAKSDVNKDLYFNTQLAKFIIKNLVSDLKANTRL